MLWTQHHNGIFRSDDDCRTWLRIENAPVSSFGFGVAVHPLDPEVAWFAPAEADAIRIPVDGRMIVNRTDDGGRTFRTLASGLPQEHAYHLVYRHCLELEPSGARLALGSTTGSLWVSDDRGEEFARVSSDLPPVLCLRWC